MQYSSLKSTQFIITLLLAFSTMLISCGPGGSPAGPKDERPSTGRPARKKMPDPGSGGLANGWDCSLVSQNEQSGVYTTPLSVGQAQLPFVLTDTMIELDGKRLPFYMLHAPFPDYDYLLPFAHQFEPLLTGWMNTWPSWGKAGAILDLSQGGASQRSDWLLQNEGAHFSFHLVLLWDKPAAGRTDAFLQTLQTLSIVQCTHLQKDNGSQQNF